MDPGPYQGEEPFAVPAVALVLCVRVRERRSFMDAFSSVPVAVVCAALFLAVLVLGLVALKK
jgi:hypothetical protein